MYSKEQLSVMTISDLIHDISILQVRLQKANSANTQNDLLADMKLEKAQLEVILQGRMNERKASN